jgi:hypothetical protein
MCGWGDVIKMDFKELESLVSPVSIVTNYGWDNREIVVRFAARAGNFSLF